MTVARSGAKVVVRYKLKGSGDYFTTSPTHLSSTTDIQTYFSRSLMVAALVEVPQEDCKVCGGPHRLDTRGRCHWCANPKGIRAPITGPVRNDGSRPHPEENEISLRSYPTMKGMK